MEDSLQLEVHDLEVQVLTGIYSEETHLPQPLRISLTIDLVCPARFAPDTPLAASKNYLDLKNAATTALPPAATRAASPVALRSPQRAAQRAVGAASPAPRTPSPGGSSLRRAAPRSAASAATAEAELHSPEGECSFIYRYILREVLLTV